MPSAFRVTALNPRKYYEVVNTVTLRDRKVEQSKQHQKTTPTSTDLLRNMHHLAARCLQWPLQEATWPRESHAIVTNLRNNVDRVLSVTLSPMPSECAKTTSPRFTGNLPKPPSGSAWLFGNSDPTHQIAEDIRRHCLRYPSSSFSTPLTESGSRHFQHRTFHCHQHCQIFIHRNL